MDIASQYGCARVMINQQQAQLTKETRDGAVAAMKAMAEYGRTKNVKVSFETRGVGTPEYVQAIGMKPWEFGLTVFRDAGANSNVDIGNAICARGLATAKRLRVRGGVHEIIVVYCNGSHDIVMFRQKRLEGATRRQIRAHVEKGMAEVPQLHAPGFQELACDGLTAQQVSLELLDGRRVQITMRVRVVAQFESGIQPHLEQPDAAIDGLRGCSVDEQLVFIDETDGGDVVLAHGGQQPPREFLEVCRLVDNDTRVGGRQIVERHRNRPRCGLLRDRHDYGEKHRAHHQSAEDHRVQAGHARQFTLHRVLRVLNRPGTVRTSK